MTADLIEPDGHVVRAQRNGNSYAEQGAARSDWLCLSKFTLSWRRIAATFVRDRYRQQFVALSTEVGGLADHVF